MKFDLIVTTGDLIALGFGSLGLLGLWFAYRQIRLTQLANSKSAVSTRAEFALLVSQWFFDDRQTMKLFYRLDYNTSDEGFRFDAAAFPHSEDEYEVDRLLYKLSHVGGLIRRGVLEAEDVDGLRAIIRISIESEGLGKYLSWLQSEDQVPGHADFLDSVFLYEKLFPDRFQENDALRKYQQSAENR